MTTRTIRFTNIYEDGDEVVNVGSVEIPGDLTAMTDDERHEYLDGILYPLTGTGRVQGNAGYFAESVDDLTPAISMEWC